MITQLIQKGANKMENGKLTYADLPKIYEELSADLPIEGAETASSEKTRKGYDTTGYGYQFHVNRMNEVLFGHWRAIHKVFKEVESKTSKGKAMYNIVIHMVIEIGNWHFVDGENKFEALAMADGYGEHTSLELGSAHKGAYTNAFKKVSAMLGVGRKAFEGTLDEDMRAHEQEQKNPPASEKTITTLKSKWEQVGGSVEDLAAWIQNKYQKAVDVLTESEASTIIAILDDRKRKQEQTQESTETKDDVTDGENPDGKQRKRFFAICDKKKLSEKQQKAIIYFYLQKTSRADVKENEFKQINDVLEKATPEEIQQTVIAAVEKKQAQGGAA
jgi:hypothetical protein